MFQNTAISVQKKGSKSFYTARFNGQSRPRSRRDRERDGRERRAAAGVAVAGVARPPRTRLARVARLPHLAHSSCVEKLKIKQGPISDLKGLRGLCWPAQAAPGRSLSTCRRSSRAPRRTARGGLCATGLTGCTQPVKIRCTGQAVGMLPAAGARRRSRPSLRVARVRTRRSTILARPFSRARSRAVRSLSATGREDGSACN